MRVLQAMAGARHGGAEIFFERLAGAFAARPGIEQKLLIRRNIVRAARLAAQGIAVEELPFGGPLDLVTSRGFRAAVRDFAPMAVLTWMNRATAYCPRPKGGFVHVARLGGYYNLKYYRHCDHLIGNTQGIVDYLVRQGWPAARAHYLPNFVPATRAAPVDRSTLATPDDAPVLLGMGRLHENKAFDVVLQALADLPQAYFWLAGDGPLGPALKQLADNLGVADRVRFLGWRDDGPALLAAADVLVCPSRIEPLGNVILEAWAQGVPVVAAAAAGPSTLIETQVSGLLAPIDDADALARGVQRLIGDRDLCRDLAAAGRAQYEAQYSEPVVAARYIEFLTEVVSACAA